MASGSYAERIREARPRLSKSFQRLADYILDSYVQAALMTASELAHEVDVDAATVVRFAQTLKYAGFPDLQDEIKARVLGDLLLNPKEGGGDANTLPALADRSFREVGEALERARRLMDPAPLEELLQAFGKAPRVLLLADVFARPVLDDLQRHLQSVGVLGVPLVAEEGALARSLAAAGEGDMLLAIDLMGDTPLISAAMAQAKAAGLLGAVIVGGASFESARKAEIVIEVQRQEQNEAAGLVLGAFVHALGNALRWRYPDRYKEQQTKMDRAMRRFVTARQARND
jgi:RpiR family carbohydrate utilization transcriptional regulator